MCSVDFFSSTCSQELKPQLMPDHMDTQDTVLSASPPACQEIQDHGDTMLTRIDHLPDEILVHILSYLPTLAENSRTAILSRRWRYLWHNITRFDFDPSTMMLHGKRGLSHESYISCVNSFIQTRAAVPVELPLVKQLLFRYTLLRKHSRDIHRWINFAIANRVETLHLEFGIFEVNKQFKLSEKFWYRAPLGLSSLKWLKSFSLKYVNVSKQFVECILSNCPILEELSFDRAGNFKTLDISGAPPFRLKQLKILSVKACTFNILSAPYLTSLNVVSRTFHPRRIHIPMLTDLTIGSYNRFTPYINELLKHFWSYLPKLKRLELTMIVAQNFKYTEMPRLVTLRYLKMTFISSGCINFTLCEIIKFISNCPLLETFALQALWNFGIHKSPIYESEKVRSNTKKLYGEMEKSCVFEHLKALELYSAEGEAIYLKVVECIITKSPNLKKLVVDTRNKNAIEIGKIYSSEIIQAVKAKAEVLCQERHSQIDIQVIV